MSISVLLIGATGLVGNLTLQKLLQNNEISEVRIITRRETGIVHEKLKELVIDFERLHEFKAFMQGDVLINCLGSTMKKAGSKASFERFDHYYPLEIAKICRENGTKRMILLSAMGAKKDAIFFYNRIKGLLELDCESLGFESLMILQPSLISGNRNEHRPMEKIANAFFSIITPLLPDKIKQVSAHVLANTILKLSVESNEKGTNRIRFKNFVH